MQPSGGVDDDDVRISRLGCAYSVIHHGCGVAALLMAHDIGAGALRPHAELLCGGGSEGVPCAKQHLLALRLIAGGKLADRRRLSDTVYADHEYDRGLGRKLHFGVVVAEHLHQKVNECLPCGSRLHDALTIDHALIVIQKLCRRLCAHVAHHEKLLKLVVKVLAVGVEVTEELL